MHHEIVVSFVKAQTDLWRPLRLSEKLFATRGSFLTLYDALCAFSQMETLVRAARCFKRNLLGTQYFQTSCLEIGTSIILITKYTL